MARGQTIGLLVAGGVTIVAVTAATMADPCITHWDPAVGTPGLNAWVLGMYNFDPGGARTGVQPGLYVGGGFTMAGTIPAARIARWNGATWSALGAGIGDGNGSVWAITSYDEGAGRGAALFVGGDFMEAGGLTVNRIARWNGASWSTVGGGMNAEVRGAMIVFNDGSGAELYVGGNFTLAGATPVSHIARWNGSRWSDVGGGVTGPTPSVRALAIFDDGTGPSLIAGGDFSSAGGVAANGVAKWDGGSWSPLGSGVNAIVRTLAVFNDGTGPALVAGGDFTSAGGAPAARIARWKNGQWSAMSSGMNATVRSMSVFDEGAGPKLYVGGDFTTAGGATVNGITRWTGSQWEALGPGMDTIVHATAVVNGGPGEGQSLYAAGMFTMADGVAAGRISRRVGCVFADLNGDGRVTGLDLAILLGQWTGASAYAPCPPPQAADLNHDCKVNGLDLAIMLGVWG